MERNFLGLHADITVHKLGRVQVSTEKVQFCCNLDSMENDVLTEIDNILGIDENYRAFRKLRKKIKRILARSTM